MRTLAFLIPLLFLGAAAADECVGTTSTTSAEQIVIELPNGDDPFYVATDLCQIDCTLSIWIYHEANGVPGLQRGDEVVDDTCGRQAYESDASPL